MRSDSRLSRMLHVLIHMNRHDKPVTSESIAQMLSTNAVVVRRTMSGLREHGYVNSEKGHGGGWSLARPLSEISLLDIYRAIGSPGLFALGSSGDHAGCLVEQAVNARLDDALREAEAVLLRRLADTRLSDLARDFDTREAACKRR
jgi:Rrf2 family protein